jgi:hypothetical protein
MELKFYNPETKTEHELVYKRRTGALREKMRELANGFSDKQELLKKLESYSIDKGLLSESFNDRLIAAVNEGVISKDDFKKYLSDAKTKLPSDTDAYYLALWQLICEPKEQILTELWNKPVTSKGKINDFWLEQDIIEVEEACKSFRNIMGL